MVINSFIMCVKKKFMAEKRLNVECCRFQVMTACIMLRLLVEPVHCYTTANAKTFKSCSAAIRKVSLTTSPCSAQRQTHRSQHNHSIIVINSKCTANYEEARKDENRLSYALTAKANLDSESCAHHSLR